MSALDLLYIDRRRALDLGFTHEGTLFGVPAWMMDVSTEQVVACPKVPALQVWTLLVDGLLELAAHFMSADQTIKSPIAVKQRIPLGERDDLDPARGIIGACVVMLALWALVFGAWLADWLPVS